MINFNQRLKKLEEQVKGKLFDIELEDGSIIRDISTHDIMDVFHEQLEARREDREPEHDLIDRGIFTAKKGQNPGSLIDLLITIKESA